MKCSSMREHYIYSTSNIHLTKQKRVSDGISGSRRQRRQNCFLLSDHAGIPREDAAQRGTQWTCGLPTLHLGLHKDPGVVVQTCACEEEAPWAVSITPRLSTTGPGLLVATSTCLSRAGGQEASRRKRKEECDILQHSLNWLADMAWLGWPVSFQAVHISFAVPYCWCHATSRCKKVLWGECHKEPLFNVNNISVWSDAEQISRLRLRIPVQRKEPQEPWVAMGINVYLQKVKTYHSFSFQLNMGKEFLRFSSLKKSVIKLSGGKRLTCSHRIHYFSNKCYVAFLYVYIVNSPVFAMYFK